MGFFHCLAAGAHRWPANDARENPPHSSGFASRPAAVPQASLSASQVFVRITRLARQPARRALGKELPGGKIWSCLAVVMPRLSRLIFGATTQRAQEMIVDSGDAAPQRAFKL